MNARGVQRWSGLFNLHTAIELLGLAAAAGLVPWLGNALVAGGERTATAWIGIGFVLIATAMRPSWGLILWLALAPFTSWLSVDLGSSIPDLSLNRIAPFFMAFILLAQAAAGRRRLARPTLLDGLAVLYVLGLMPGVINSPAPLMVGVRTVFDWVVVPLLIYGFARNLVDEPQAARALLAAIVTVGAFLGVIAAIDQLANVSILAPDDVTSAPYGPYAHTVISVFGSPAIMAMSLTMSVPAGLFLIARADRWRGRLGWTFALLATLLGSLLTYVRGGWLASVVGLVTIVVLSRRVRKRLLPALVIATLIVLVLGGLVINPQAIQSRLSTQNSVEYRAEAWRVGLQVVQRSPIVGLGFFTFRQETLNAGWAPRFARSSIEPVSAPHNLFLYILASAGLVGLLPLLGILATIFFQGVTAWRRARRNPAQDEGLPALLIATLLAYLVIVNTFDALAATYGNLVLFAVAGMTFAATPHRPGPSTA